jgi:hypothetical protein
MARSAELSQEWGMETRRTVMGTIVGATALAGFGMAAWSETDGMPSPAIIKGEPTVLDYGSGLKVPCTKDAFFVLWEGGTFWLTFGFGASPSVDAAMAQAAKQAAGVMKFLLLTLAFAPERMSKVDGNGWRKKDPKARDFVLGELDLPIVPSRPLSDVFLGGGNIEISPFWNWGNTGTNTMEPMQRGAPNATPSAAPPGDMRQANRHAFSNCFVLKKDLSLDDVRKRAVILQP